MSQKSNTLFHRLGRLALSAYHHVFTEGALRSALVGMSVDRHDQFLPWYSDAAVRWLQKQDFSRCLVFEWSMGSSTLWWAENALEVWSVDDSETWYQKVSKLFHYTNLNSFRLLKRDAADYIECLGDAIAYGGMEVPNVVCIDGSHRYECLATVMNFYEVRTCPVLIILDNSDWFPESRELLANRGYVCIDFVGTCALVPYLTQTTIAFREDRGVPMPTKPKGFLLPRQLDKNFETHLREPKK